MSSTPLLTHNTGEQVPTNNPGEPCGPASSGAAQLLAVSSDLNLLAASLPQAVGAIRHVCLFSGCDLTRQLFVISSLDPD